MYDPNLKRKITRRMWMAYYQAKNKRAGLRTKVEKEIIKHLDKIINQKI